LKTCGHFRAETGVTLCRLKTCGQFG